MPPRCVVHRAPEHRAVAAAALAVVLETGSVVHMPAFSTIIWVGTGLLMAYVLWKSGIGMLRSMTSTLPPPPPSGELRKVNVRYRCSVCGLEIKLTLAPDEDPPPPKHCLEDMDIVAPIYD